MPRFLADTNCLVALLVPWHEHHERILHDVERRLDAGDALVVAAPTLMETYAVFACRRPIAWRPPIAAR